MFLFGFFYFYAAARPTAADGGELFAVVPLRQPARLERRVHEGLVEKFPYISRRLPIADVALSFSFLPASDLARVRRRRQRLHRGRRAQGTAPCYHVSIDMQRIERLVSIFCTQNFLRDLLTEAQRDKDVTEDKLIEYTDTMVSAECQ